MAFEYEFLSEHDLIVLRVWGDVTVEEALSMVPKVCSEVELPEIPLVLHDRRAARSVRGADGFSPGIRECVYLGPWPGSGDGVAVSGRHVRCATDAAAGDAAAGHGAACKSRQLRDQREEAVRARLEALDGLKHALHGGIGCATRCRSRVRTNTM